MIDPTLNIAIRAARKAGGVILRYHNQLERLSVENKAPYDFVSEVDKMAEDLIVDEIQKKFPDHAILAEERGETRGNSDYRWIIDPLDGTTNYLHGLPQYAVSIALYQKNTAVCAVVYDPFKEELFSASRGRGAYLNNRRIRTSAVKNFHDMLIGTGFPFRSPEFLDAYLAMFKTIHPLVSGIRRAGSAALDLAYVAAGRLDGFWEVKLKTWDMAAGVLLVREAGGFVGDFSGGRDYLKTGNVVAGNATAFHKILKLIAGHRGSELQR